MKIAVVGGGPAGLRAAEVAAAAGANVIVYDAKPSVGRKFLVAGRGGLNLTKEEPIDRFLRNYQGPGLPVSTWSALIQEFDPSALRTWAAELGVETFTATSGRVYPRAMKAAPLLRRWVQRLKENGVRFALRHRWTGFGAGTQLHFATTEGPVEVECDAAVLAFGGASWPETGSDGAWTAGFTAAGLVSSPWQAANCGWETAWPPDLLTQAEGWPLKNITARAADSEAVGELLITRYGLEGGIIYQLGAALRSMTAPELVIDLKPSFTAAQLAEKLGPKTADFLAAARQRWKLSPPAAALLDTHPDKASWLTPSDWAAAAKHLSVRLVRPRPFAEAISCAGGACWSELDESLMLTARPGIFLAGEMIDWEAPTGGYLMQACFATGTAAGKNAARWVHCNP